MGIRTIEQVKASLSPVPVIAESKFKVGDKVTFINANGLEFSGLTVIGFDDGSGILCEYEKHIYLDSDAYWFPHAEGELIAEN